VIPNAAELLTQVRQIHAAIRKSVVAACERQTTEALSTIVTEQAGDVVFAIDRIAEEALLEHFSVLGQKRSFLLIAEGLGESGMVTFPAGLHPADAELRILLDPIDGTRGLMYQKRAAWILTGIASNRGSQTSIADIELAVQTEIPLLKQHLCDSLWAIAGQGAFGERYNRLTGERTPLVMQPSRATTIEQGYGSIARFFPGNRAELAQIDDELIERVLGPCTSEKPQAFEDQYISTGGQLYELMMGHDRWVADLRSLLAARAGVQTGLCCHPYDICTALIAHEAGVIVTDEQGGPITAPLDVFTNLSWIGYANHALRNQLASPLHMLLTEHHLFTTTNGIATPPDGE
jgi:fructose-1,6-bisphosphatase/inositol monophosphatase family enzyme